MAGFLPVTPAGCRLSTFGCSDADRVPPCSYGSEKAGTDTEHGGFQAFGMRGQYGRGESGGASAEGVSVWRGWFWRLGQLQ